MSADTIGELIHVALLIALLVIGWMLDRHHKSSTFERSVIRTEVDYILSSLGISRPEQPPTDKGK